MEYFSLFLGIGFIAVGVVGIRHALGHIKAAKRSVYWPRVQGVIVRSKVVLNDQSYLPSIEYEYEVDGRSYSGDSLTVGFPYSSSQEWAAGFVSRHPVGSEVRVAVDPSNPSASVLEPGTRWHMYAVLFAAILLTTLGCAVLYLQCTYHAKQAQQGTQDRRAEDSARLS